MATIHQIKRRLVSPTLLLISANSTRGRPSITKQRVRWPAPLPSPVTSPPSLKAATLLAAQLSGVSLPLLNNGGSVAYISQFAGRAGIFLNDKGFVAGSGDAAVCSVDAFSS